MSQKLQQCPHCGAYVLGGDAICPRCDHPLKPTAPGEGVAPDPPTAIFPEAAEEESAPPEPQTAIFPAPEEESAPPEPQTAIFPEAAEEAGLPAADATASEGSTPLFESEPPGDFAAPERAEARPQPPEVMPGPAEEAPAAHDEDSGAVPAPDFTALFPPEEVEAEARLPFEDTDRRAPEAVHEDTPAHPASAEPVAPPAELEPPQGRTQITPSRQFAGPGYIVPPAPYTPPPFTPPPMPAVYGPAPVSGYAYLQQRVAEYVQGGYRVHGHSPAQAVLSCGKNLGVGGWMLALITGIGFAWYLLTLALSGFASDRVYITLEADGRVYEDGPGAAHIRRERARAGRRWALFGGALLALSLLLALVLGAVAYVYLGDDGHQAALREAYPEITLFEERFSAVEPDPGDVPLARDGLVIWGALLGVAVVGVWGGATLAVIGTVHHGAYRVPVPSLPGW
ncbi:MAG: hypothetical protein OZ934_15080 [Anaerolineae bacterium]|nr:hypothetical protein [Anaerolineae bacterium]